MDDRFLRDRALLIAQQSLPQGAKASDILKEADTVLAWLKADDKAQTASATSQVHESHTQKA